MNREPHFRLRFTMMRTMKIKSDDFPFVYGAQYYRAPTPEPEFWEADFAHMRQLGFNTVKFWVQWRWSERAPDDYYWQDLDELMRLAERFELRVILNLICDVMPVWAEDRFPDCRMIDRNGQPVPTEAVLCRQLGGYPGPCYNHLGMLVARQAFFQAALKHFSQFPALLSWDVWNEPEHHLALRSADNLDHLLCYCPHCQQKFRQWLGAHYDSVEALNRRWGRCYRSFEEAELPRNAQLIADFIDWRMFQLETLTAEAEWRLALVRELAPQTFPHLHVVPHTIHCFNSVNCVDDFALAEKCEIFGASMMGDPLFAAAASSAAGNKLFYNAEWHINFGSSAIHPRIIDRETFLRELLPQLGWNVRGVLYWQFRPESLGFESPAWGMIHPDGSDRPVARWAREFRETVTPYLPLLMRSRRRKPACAILKSVRNELFFQAFPQEKGNWLYRSIRGYADTLLDCNIPFSFLSSEELEQQDLAHLRLLILPAAHCLSQAEADAVDRFCRRGGVLWVEGSVGGYEYDRGRYATRIPGCGLAECWGVRETESTSSFHLDCSAGAAAKSAAIAEGDVAKALHSAGARGGEFLPLNTSSGEEGWGALLLSALQTNVGETIASYQGTPCVVRFRREAGVIFYCGTYLGIAAAERSAEFLRRLLEQAAEFAGITPPAVPRGLRLLSLYPENDGETSSFQIVENVTDRPLVFTLPTRGVDLFGGGSGKTLRVAPHTAALLICGPSAQPGRRGCSGNGKSTIPCAKAARTQS